MSTKMLISFLPVFQLKSFEWPGRVSFSCSGTINFLRWRRSYTCRAYYADENIIFPDNLNICHETSTLYLCSLVTRQQHFLHRRNGSTWSFLRESPCYILKPSSLPRAELASQLARCLSSIHSMAESTRSGP